MAGGRNEANQLNAFSKSPSSGTSLVPTGAAATAGWHLVRRAGARCEAVALGDLLAGVADAPLWTMDLHPAQKIKRAFVTACGRKWGVTPGMSGWERFRRSWPGGCRRRTRLSGPECPPLVVGIMNPSCEAASGDEPTARDHAR